MGAATFALERRLPYKKMLIVTGVLIALVLTVMVGNTVRVRKRSLRRAKPERVVRPPIESLPEKEPAKEPALG